MAWARTMALVVGWLGVVVFAAALAASLLAPAWVEQQGRNAIRHQVEIRVNERIDALDGVFLEGMATRLRQQERDRLAQAQALLRARLPERVAQVVAEMADLDCACRRGIQDWLEGGLRQSMSHAAQLDNRLTRLIRAQYMDTAAHLMREWRIVSGANLLVFGLLVAGAWVRRRASWHVFPATVLLVLSAAVVAYFYVFHQNWLHTVVFNDYVGWSYLGWLGLAFGFASDLAFNRARLTAQVVSGVLDGVGSSLSVLPC